MVIGTSSLLTIGCSSTAKIHENLLPHAIALQGDGQPFNLATQTTPAKNYNYDKHIQSIIAGIRSKKTNKVLIFIHGGMVPINKSIKEATDQILTKDPRKTHNPSDYWDAENIYPIYVNWESGMSKAYGDHLWKIRQGTDQKKIGPVTAPFYAIADAGRSISRVPITTGTQIPNLLDIQNQEPTKNPRRDGPQIPSGNIKIPRDNELVVPPSENALRKAQNIIPGSLRLVTTPILDTVGKSSWDNMLRRTQTVFRSPAQETKTQKAGIKEGGLTILLDALRKENNRRENAGKSPLQITLIGHSMGSIISNEVLQRYDDLRFHRIVYLAAACTIRDFQNSVIPYLRANKSTEFHSVGLHPYADRRETTAYGTLPQGSLLDWIDDFASSPETRMDHTLGKINNVMRVIGTVERNIPQQVLNRIYFNAFPYLPKENKRYPYPRTHGSFNDLGNIDGIDAKKRPLQFWMEEYWTFRRSELITP